MLDFEKVILFCNSLAVSFEEFMLLYSLHVRHLNRTPHLHSQINEYYVKNDKDWIAMIDSLEQRELLVVLKRDKNNPEKLLVKHLQVTEKFVSLLFADPDETWKKFISRYPSEGVTPNGLGTFTTNVIKDGDKDYFNQFIYKNADPEKAYEIIELMESMFDWDENEQKPTLPAQFSISRFLRSWDVIVATHREKESANVTWSKRL